VAFFAATAGAAAVEVVRSRPLVAVDPKGIALLATEPPVTYPWSAVEAVTLWTALGLGGVTEDRMAVVLAAAPVSPVPAVAEAVTETDWEGGGAVAVRARLVRATVVAVPPRVDPYELMLSDSVSLSRCTVDAWELRAVLLALGEACQVLDRRR
jgi:hypothetical protein